MTLITISDLTTADSFLNELKKTETTQIFGGGSHSGGCYEKVEKPYCDYGWKKEEYYYEEEECYYEEEKCYEEKEYSYDKKKSGWKTGC